jgi:hypothetical protein
VEDMKKTISLTIEEEIHSKFQKYCESMGMKVSTRIEALMKEDLQLGKQVIFCEAKDCDKIVPEKLRHHSIKLCEEHRKQIGQLKDLIMDNKLDDGKNKNLNEYIK